MAISKQQKILAGVVAMGLAAVAVDQLILGSGASGPASASASAGVMVPTAAAAPSAGTPQAISPSAEQAPEVITGHPELSSRLDALSATQSLDVTAIIDAFTPRGEWGKPATPETVRRNERPFSERHKLDAVMAVSSGKVVIVDGRTLHVGNLYDGHVLREIGESYAVFERDGISARLELPGIDEGR